MANNIPMKAYKVKDPNGTIHLVYAQTSAGAIRDSQKSLKGEWSADLATGEDMFLAARNGTPILNAPLSLSPRVDPAQPDILGGGE